ncbi:MAG: PadR family transcriptional regulator [Candidatus Bilamarchaeaceae archaeon]
MALVEGEPDSGKGRLRSSNERFLGLYLIWRLMKEPMYGYKLIGEIGGLGLSAHRPSTLYLVLSRMENLGLIRGTSKKVAGRTRRIYKTTKRGEELYKRVRSTRIKGPLREFIGDLLN